MGSCFSRGKGSHPSSQYGHKHKDDLTVDCGTAIMGASLQQQQQLVSANGNAASPPPLPLDSVVMATTCLVEPKRTASFRLQQPHHHNSNSSTVVTVLATTGGGHRIGRSNSERRGGGGEQKSGAVGAAADAKIAALFDAYCDPSDDVIMADGIERLCSDLALSPDEFRVLLLAWKMNAGQMCRFTRDEFTSGCRDMRVDTLRGIQTKLVELSSDVTKDPELFKDLYRFTFRFGLDPSQNQRILPSEMAVVLWKLVFSIGEPPILERWLRFLESHPHVRGVPRDTWNMFLNFAEAVGDDLSSYDDAEAWPSLFDDFVEFENDQANPYISKEKREAVIGQH
ncbi:hypothetical protein LSTR_LSTR006971 [Laodelphax striatellus]|uniref:Defective in cullin neddylation protein n=1 Tax=Laodelphax striatellus TaxID=195883 RepID=A0A482WPB9_LAOST|nr:hypothetical protein LSTR_LSTR006971 [Laodelphax striatellus]